MRRRLLWLGVVAAAAGGVAALIIAFPSPGPPKEARTSTTPAEVVPVDRNQPFAGRKDEVLAVAAHFINTAVTRHRTAESWELVCPALRDGYTKETWSKGDIPVVPYPVETASWRLSYSFENEVDLRVALFPPRKTKKRALVFDITLQRCQEADERWLVASFMPAPSASGGLGSASTLRGGGTRLPGLAAEAGPLPRHTSQAWLFLPLGFFALALAALAAIGVKSWRGARVYRSYVREVRERQTSSSRPS